MHKFLIVSIILFSSFLFVCEAQNLPDSTSYFYALGDDADTVLRHAFSDDFRKFDYSSYFFLSDYENDTKKVKKDIIEGVVDSSLFSVGDSVIFFAQDSTSYAYVNAMNGQNLHYRYVLSRVKTGVGVRSETLARDIVRDLYVKNESEKPEIKRVNHPDFILIFLLLSVLLIILVRIFFPDYLDLVFRVSSNYDLFSRFFIEKNLSYVYAGFLLLASFFIVVPVVFYAFMYSVNEAFSSVISFWQLSKIFLFVLSAYFVKYFFSKFISWAFEIKDLSDEYNFEIKYKFELLGIILPFLLFSYLYASSEQLRVLLLWIMVLVFVLVYVLRVMRFLKIFSKKHFSLFYMFLYLCTLEILPVALLAKYFVSIQ